MKKLIISLLIILVFPNLLKPASYTMIKLKVRVTHYSSKEIGEGRTTACGEDARNDNGVALPKALAKRLGIKFGSPVIYHDKIYWYIDSFPTKKALKFNNLCIDICHWSDIRSKPKTRAVSRELNKRFDKGWEVVTFLIPD